MSESENKNDSKMASVASAKPCDSKVESHNASTRGKYEKNDRGGRRYNSDFSRGRSRDFGRSRGSYRGGFRNDNFGRRPFKRNWSNSREDGKRKRLEIGSRLKESDVGITEFVGDHGFSGIIKDRYSDFNVNEIDLDGQVAKLTNQDIPADVDENLDLEELKKAVPEAIWDKLQTLKNAESTSIEIDVTDLDKDQRRAIHGIAKSMTNVISQTIDKESKKMMVISLKEKGKSSGQTFCRDNRVDWKKRGGEYCHFLLHKSNMDTMSTINQLAMNLRIKPNIFSYAGTKDRRAWTTQWVSVRKVEPSDILRAAKCIRGAFVGNFKFVKEPLKLGMLSGNFFRIAIRNVIGTDEQIEKSMVSLRENGLINYCGLQRFGTVPSIPTHEIGKALLQSKWHEAIELILKPRDGEQDRDLIEARKIYAATKDACTAFDKIKKSDKIEATLLKGLCSSGNNNPQGALDSLPRNARLLYIHAYQSFLWNHMVSRRIREFGKNPIVGDLVYDRTVKEQNNDNDDFMDEREIDVMGADDETVTEHIAESTEMISKQQSEPEVETSISKTEETTETSETPTTTSIKEVTDATECCLKIDENVEDKDGSIEKAQHDEPLNIPAVKILTEEDLPNYTLADVLMPLVGWKVTYPPYAQTWFDEFLAKDGLTTELRQKNKKYSLGGTYRRILRVPLNVSWKIVHYKEKHSDLILSDIHELRKLPSPEDQPDGQFKAVIIEMTLNPSTYATMALREILKYDTSSAAQVALCVARDSELSSKANLSVSTNEEKQCEEDSNGMEVDSKSQEKKHSDLEANESAAQPALCVARDSESSIKANLSVSTNEEKQREDPNGMEVDSNSQEEKPSEPETKESSILVAVQADIKERSDIGAEVADEI